MATIWLAISNRDNWEIVKKWNIWGVAKRHINTIKKVKSSDLLLVYVSSQVIGKETLPVIITGAYEITSEMFEDDVVLFTSPKIKKARFIHYESNLNQ